MNSNSLIWIFLLIGSTVGGFIPALWGGGFLSFSSMIFSAIGGILGIYLAFKITRM